MDLPARQFVYEDLPDDIGFALQETGMNPTLPEGEPAGSMVMRDMECTIALLKDLKRMGVHVAIDDFATGSPSRSTLKRFPPDTIRIDGSFIRDVVDNIEGKGPTGAPVAVGGSLSLTVKSMGSPCPHG